MPTWFQAALGHRTRGQQVPTLRLLMLLRRDVGINGKKQPALRKLGVQAACLEM